MKKDTKTEKKLMGKPTDVTRAVAEREVDPRQQKAEITVKDTAKREERKGGTPAKNGKEKPTYDPPSKAPLHQVLPFVFLVASVFFGVCFVSTVIRGSEAENLMGPVGHWLCRIFFGLFGYGAFAVPVMLFSLALLWRKSVDGGNAPLRAILTAVFALTLSAYLHILLVIVPAPEGSKFVWDLPSLYLSGADLVGGGKIGGGGVIGGVIGQALFWLLNTVGSSILCIAALLLLAMFLVGTTPVQVWTLIRYRVRRAMEERERRAAEKKEQEEGRRLAEEVLGDGIAVTSCNSGKGKKDKGGKNAPAPVAVSPVPEEDTESAKDRKSARTKKAREEEDVLPVMEDETILHPAKNDDELDLSAVYDTATMQWARQNATQKPIPTVNESAQPAEPQATPVQTTKPNPTEETPEPAEKPKEPVGKKDKSTTLDGVEIKQAGSESEQYLENDEPEADAVITVPAEPEVHPYLCPPIDLMDKPSSSGEVSEETILEGMQTLKAVLESFNVNIQEMNYSCGPTITRYEVRPEAGTRVRQVSNLVDDIALGLAKSGVRIEAPIPGKAAIGIEVPNDHPEIVYLRSLIDSPEFKESKGKLSACLGADISGKHVIMDIVKMPHLLIAGATGMGKSVCINCLVASLLYRSSPKDVRLIMVDPKQVEFVPYKDIPHLFVPIITDPRAATAALSAAIDEMEDRFTKIKDLGVRDIRGYNDIAAIDPDVEKMPYIVIIIDELADLMMTASEEVETSICRLAQKARAAGIHLIIGTQRPSVDVVKGTIKANIPSRIAFTVSSQVDSKTILDYAGAEKLIGRGDMLYAPVGAMKPIRVQGAFVNDGEIERITDYVKVNNDPVKYDEQFMKRMSDAAARIGAKKNEGLETDTDGTGASKVGDDEDLLVRAMDAIFTFGRASTSLLQRKLGIGYGKAAKVLDALEELGYISGPDGAKPRSILIDQNVFMEQYINNGGKGLPPVNGAGDTADGASGSDEQ